MCCLFVFPHNDFPQVRMPHQEVIVCFMIFPVGVQGSVMRKPHMGSRDALKVGHRLLSQEAYRTVVLLCHCYIILLCDCAVPLMYYYNVPHC